VKSLLKERKLLERRQPLNLLKRLCALLIKKRILLKILPKEEVVKEEEEDISEAGWGEQTLSKRKGRFTLHTLQKKWIT